MTAHFGSIARFFKWFVLVGAVWGLHCGEIVLPLDPEAQKTDTENLYCTGSTGTTYYVRLDGGTPIQCTGTEDAPYPGEGEGQPCAFAHPSYAFPSDGRVVLAPGDRLVIGKGEYAVGTTGTNVEDTEECRQGSPDRCAMGSVPSGNDNSHPTCVVGEGWNDGCENPPVLTGVGHTPWLLNLQNTGFATVGCLELMDASPCVAGHPDIEADCDSHLDETDAPIGQNGIFAADSEHITLTDMSIHGLAGFGILGRGLTDWTLNRVRVIANGNGGIAVLPSEPELEECAAFIQMMRETADQCLTYGLSDERCDEFRTTVLEMEGSDGNEVSDCKAIEEDLDQCYAENRDSLEACADIEEKLTACRVSTEKESGNNSYEALFSVMSRCRDYGFPEALCVEMEDRYERCATLANEQQEIPSCRGKMRLNDVAASFNGCGEKDRQGDGDIVNCYSGDNSSGLLVVRSAADWVFSSGTFTHNTRDGVSVQLTESNLSVEMKRTHLEGNAGVQLNITGNATIINSIVAGNCEYFSDSPYSESVVSCMDEGVAMQFDLLSGQEVKAVNNTVWGHGKGVVLLYFADSLSFLAVNNIFAGNEAEGAGTRLFMPDLRPESAQLFNNMFFKLSDIEELGLCDTGSFLDNTCKDPLLVSTDGGFGQEMDLSLRPTSPAIDYGLPVNTREIVPEVDFLNNPRPSGEGVDVGAIEYLFE